MVDTKEREQAAVPPHPSERKNRMAKDADPKSLVKDDKIKLRRACGCVDTAISLMEQIKDILKNEPEKAPLVIESLKKLNTQAEDVMTALGY